MPRSAPEGTLFLEKETKGHAVELELEVKFAEGPEKWDTSGAEFAAILGFFLAS